MAAKTTPELAPPVPAPDAADAAAPPVNKKRSRIVDVTEETLVAGITGVGITGLPAPRGTFQKP